MLKKAAEFLKEIDNKKTLIIFDTDGDGIGSAAILAKTIKRLFKKMPEAMPANHGLSFIDSSMVKKIKSKKFDAIITVDAAVDEKPEYVLELAKKSRILIIDHHQIHRNLNNSKILHVNPNLWKTKFVSYKYCTSKIVYDICSKLTNIEDLDWLAGIGIVNDKSEDTWKGFLKGVYKKYKISSPKLRLTNDIITSGYCYSGRKGVMTGYRACLETSSPVDILRAKTNNTRRLKKFYDIIEGEIVSEMKNWKRNAEIIEDKKLIILKLNTKFSISSPISTKISFEKPHYTVLVIRKNGKVIYMSLRRQDKEVDCGRIAEKVIKNLNNASGGGHCLHSDTLIILKNGKIDKLKDVMENDNVESINFRNLNYEYSRCTKKFNGIDKNTLYEVGTTYGLSLLASPEHRVFSIKSTNNDIKVVEKKIKDLKLGDLIASVNRTNPVCSIQPTPDVSDIIKRAKDKGHRWKRVEIPKQLNKGLAQFLGYLIGDGHIEDNDVVELRDERLEVLREYEKIANKIFKCDCSISKLKNKNCWRMRLFSSTIAVFMDRLRNSFYLVEKSPNDVVLSFIRGIFDAECYASKNEVTIEMKDTDFISKLQMLLLRFGIHASKSKHKYYRLSIRGESLNNFKEIGLTAKDKMYKLNNFKFKVSRLIPIKWGELKKYIKNRYNYEISPRRDDSRYISKIALDNAKKVNREHIFDDIEKLFNINWVKVKKIKIMKKPIVLQDMETTYRNYIANGIIVHNSPAAGIHIMSKDWKIFRKRVLELL